MVHECPQLTITYLRWATDGGGGGAGGNLSSSRAAVS